MDFKESKFMYAIAGFIIVFVIAQSLFFMIRAWRHGKEIGMKTSDLKNTVTSSALFTVAPAIAILATVITLAGTLGLVLPWIRLTVIGNLQYEVTAAQAAMVWPQAPQRARAAAAAAAVLSKKPEPCLQQGLTQ